MVATLVTFSPEPWDMLMMFFYYVLLYIVLNHMANICEQFSSDYDITFNATKCKLIVFGADGDDDVSVSIDGKPVVQGSSDSHLGFLIGNNKDVDSKNIDSAINQIYGRINLLLRQFGKANCDIIYYLFKSYCMSLYGCALFNFASRNITKL